MIDRNLGSATSKPRALDTIIWGGLLAGTLDAVDGVVAFGFKGMNSIQVLQYIASGLFGMASFQGGLKTAGLGACFITLLPSWWRQSTTPPASSYRHFMCIL
jgi:hypothetical protein